MNVHVYESGSRAKDDRIYYISGYHKTWPGNTINEYAYFYWVAEYSSYYQKNWYPYSSVVLAQAGNIKSYTTSYMYQSATNCDAPYSCGPSYHASYGQYYYSVDKQYYAYFKGNYNSYYYYRVVS